MTPDPIAARARELAHFIISRTCDSSNNWSALENAVAEKITTALQAERERAIEEAACVAESHALGENIIRKMFEAKTRDVQLWSVVSKMISQRIRALAAKKVG